MKRAAVTILTVAVLAALPGMAGAQTASGEKGASAEMKGPPNANGRAEDKAMTAPMSRDETTSAKHLSGPPNANGYGKQ